MTNQKKDNRARLWTFVAYPESMPEAWTEVIQAWHVPTLVSPLHDEDLNPTGESKKSHFHIVMFFAGKKSLAQVQAFSDELSGVLPQTVHDARGIVRYLTHIDNPEKHQYSLADITCFSGATYLEYFQGDDDVDVIVAEIMEFIDNMPVPSFAEVSRFAATYKPDWFRVITSKRSYFIGKYCQSCEWEKRQEELTLDENH